MNYFDAVKNWGALLRLDKGKVGAPYGNDNAAKNHVKEVIKTVNRSLPKGEKLRSSIGRIPKNDYERVRSKINSDYDFEGKKTEGKMACHWISERGVTLNRGYCVFFMNGGRGESEPKFRIPLSAEKQDVLDMLTKEL